MKSAAVALLCLISLQVQVLNAEESFGESDDTSVASSDENVPDFVSASGQSFELVLADSTPNWLFLAPRCSIGEYLHASQCRPCSACAPDFYSRRYCQTTADAVCEWCFVSKPLRNMDFWLKCESAVKVNTGMSLFDAVPEGVRLDVVEAPVSTSVVRIPVQLQESVKWSWKVELILESLLYLAVVALLFVAFRLATRSKPYYRSVTITAPVFDENDKSNIRLAAAYLQQKLGPRRYEDLEEFV